MNNRADHPTDIPAKVGTRRIGRKRLTWLIVLVIVLSAGGMAAHQVGLLQASQAIENRQHAKAESWLKFSSVVWPKSAEWYYLSAIVNRRQQRFDATADCLKKANELGWPVSDLEREQAIAQAQSGQFELVGNKWAELFMSARSDGPEICAAYVKYNLAGFRLNDAARVIEIWKADFPDDPDPYIMEGEITSVLLRWTDAESLFKKALQLDPTRDVARVKLAEALIKQLKFDQAEKQLRMIESGDAWTPEVAASLAHCVAHQGRIDEAFQLLDSELAEHSDNVRLLAESGRLHLMKGDNEKTIEDLTVVLEQEPENTELRYSYAQALRNVGREKDAQKHFDLVDQGTKALLQLPRLTDTVVQDPENVDARFQVAAATWKWKSRRNGLMWLRSVLQFDPYHRETHLLLAQHYEEAGDPATAAHHRRLSEGR